MSIKQYFLDYKKWIKSVSTPKFEAVKINSKLSVAQKCHGNINLFTAISILLTRQFQFYSRQFQFTHGNFNFFTATRLAHGIFHFAHHLSATAADSGHQKSKPKIKSRYLKSIFKEKSENQKSKVDLRTLLGHRKN